MQTEKRHKFLRRGSGAQSRIGYWEIGVWRKTEGEVECCVRGYHCAKEPFDAFVGERGGMLAEVEVRGKSDGADSFEWREEMRVVKAYRWQKNDSILLAIFAARLLLKAYENTYHGESRPRAALKAVERYRKCPCDSHREEVEAARKDLLAACEERISPNCKDWVPWDSLASAVLKATCAVAAREVEAAEIANKTSLIALGSMRPARVILKRNRFMKKHITALSVCSEEEFRAEGVEDRVICECGCESVDCAGLGIQFGIECKNV